MCIKGRGSDSPAHFWTNESSGMILICQSEAAHLTSEWLSEIMSCILAARADGWVTFTTPVSLSVSGYSETSVPMSPPPLCHRCHNLWQGKLSACWSHWNPVFIWERNISIFGQHIFITSRSAMIVTKLFISLGETEHIKWWVSHQ